MSRQEKPLAQERILYEAHPSALFMILTTESLSAMSSGMCNSGILPIS